jgi:hypothetical protein
MVRAVTWVLGALAAAAAGVFAPAFASEANLTEITKGAPSQSYGGTLDLPPTCGFAFVTISEKPPSLADYTILDLINLATPWPIEEEVAQAEASAPITPNVPIAKLKPKPKPKHKPQAQERVDQTKAAKTTILANSRLVARSNFAAHPVD